MNLVRMRQMTLLTVSFDARLPLADHYHNMSSGKNDKKLAW